MHNISIRKIVRVCQGEWHHFWSSGRIVLMIAVWVFAYQFITVPLLQNGEKMHTSLLAIEPYIALLNSNFMILIMPVLFLVLLSDFPRVDANAYFYLVRTGKTNWVIGQLLYAFIITIGYLLMQFAGMLVPVLAKGEWGSRWSPVITDFAKNFRNTHKVRGQSVSSHSCIIMCLRGRRCLWEVHFWQPICIFFCLLNFCVFFFGQRRWGFCSAFLSSHWEPVCARHFHRCGF